VASLLKLGYHYTGKLS